MDDLTAYWHTRLPDGAIAVSWEEAGTLCWRCADFGPMERCHIVPAARGGANTPANLIRLCPHCHREQPNVEDPAVTWAWLRATRHWGYGRRHGAWLDAYAALYGEDGPTPRGNPETVGAVLQEELAAAVRHWGHADLNPATLAACVRRAEERAA